MTTKNKISNQSSTIKTNSTQPQEEIKPKTTRKKATSSIKSTKSTSKKSTKAQNPLDKLQNLRDKLYTYTTYTIDEENEVQYLQKFPQQLATDIFVELSQFIEYYYENSESKKMNEQFITTTYLPYLIVKHATNYKEYISDDIDANLEALKLLADTGVLNLILNEVLDSAEVEKVLFTVSDLLTKSTEILLETNKQKVELAKELESLDEE